MSYTVQYGTCRYDREKPPRINKKAWIIISLMGIILVASLLFPTELAQIRRHVLPFLEPEVLDAFLEMTSSISEGVDIQDAAAVFCREVIVGTSY